MADKKEEVAIGVPMEVMTRIVHSQLRAIEISKGIKAHLDALSKNTLWVYNRTEWFAS